MKTQTQTAEVPAAQSRARFEIRNRWTDAVIFAGDYASAIEAVRDAVARDPDLRDANLCGANLRDANLCGANLRDANLCGANLCGADLCGANLRDANLCGANLCGADLCGADLRGANLRDANLRDANLCGADLRGASLRDASLRDADLRDANLRDAHLRGAHLCGAKNVASVKFGFTPDASLPKRVAERVLASPDALRMDTWHTCETTHCLAGWAVRLSGAAGYALESQVGAANAGLMLMPSAAHLFFSTNEAALAWAREVLAREEGSES